MTKPKEKTREELQVEIEDGKKKIRQFENREKVLFVFEAPIDLLSFLCLFKKDWQRQSYLALGGVGEKALLRFLSDRPNIKTVFLCLDSDEAGNDACSRLVELSV